MREQDQRPQRPVATLHRILVLFYVFVAVVQGNDDASCSVDQTQRYCPENDVRGVSGLNTSNTDIVSEIKSFVDRNEPFVWRKCLYDQVQWWDDDTNLVQEEGNSIIRVRVAPRHVTDPTHFQRFGGSKSYHHADMTLRDFMQRYQDPDSLEHVYAAQIDLTKTLPSLVHRLPPISSEILEAIGPPEQETIYIGQGTKTQLHYDSRENFVCVLSGGTKSFQLYDPITSAALLYVNAKEYGNTSPIESIDYPMAKYALPVHVQLGAGDCLYLPIYWFHTVETSTREPRSISVNWWRRPDPTKKDIVGRLLCGQMHREASAKC